MRKSWTFWASALGAPAAAATFAVAATPLWAQSASPAIAPSSTMAALARQVIISNPEIAAQRQQVKITEARLQAAEAGYLPTIEANGTVQRREIDIKNGSSTNDARYTAGQAGIEARLRFYDGDRTYNSVKIAKAELEAASAGLDAITSDILLEMLTSAADVHLNRKILQYSQAQSEAIGEQLRATSRRLEFGEATRTDEELARARLATSQAGVLAATEELGVDGHRFRNVSGQSGTMVPPLPPLAPIPSSLAAAQKAALENEPRLRAARLNAQAGKSGVKFAVGALLPQLDAVSGYDYLTGGATNTFTGKYPDDRSSLYYGLELRVPIFLPRDHAEVRRARAVRDQRLSQTDIAVRTVAEDVASSWTRWQSAKSTITAAEAAVAATQEAAEGIKKEAVGGNRTLTDVLNAQNELLSARVTLERAHRNEFVARASLLAATGRLDAKAILDGRCCGADTFDRPGMSALGRPVVASTGKAAADPSASSRPQMSALGRAPDPAPDRPANDGVGTASGVARPASSALGRKLN
ncbi:TolC family protein [Sphingopyxis sp.]|uniref:TolC family protein n=1 Tax=Sphingopyxis sp. TaxID=1908224 RepID=UPI003F7142D1